MTRVGKIARLPREIRGQLNRRLRDGETGRKLVDWLNSLTEVQSLLAAEFDGRAISEQNLSEWKQGGYAEWLIQQEALAQVREMAADADELTEAADGILADPHTAGKSRIVRGEIISRDRAKKPLTGLLRLISRNDAARGSRHPRGGTAEEYA